MNMPSSTSLLPDGMPDGRALVDEGLAIGNAITMGVSSMCESHGVSSEVEYKRKMRAEGRLMTAFNIGMKTWEETASALVSIHQQCEERGFRIDRYQMQLDRRMGLPRELWDGVPKETGPMLETREQWQEVAQVVPIQPHLGDMMIGSPASVENTVNALQAGVNYIGNMSQFNWKYPSFPGDDVEQMAEMVKALGLMASKAEFGATVHSYLDDGYPAQFKDFCSYIGWSMFERHIVDDCIGARVSISYGGLTHHPVTKAAMILALETLTPPESCNAFYHSNTTDYSLQTDSNFGIVSLDDLYMMLAQTRSGSFAATMSVPVTEPLRIPTWEEIVQVQTVARRVARDADRLMETLNWPMIEGLRDRLLEGGRQFFDNLLQGLEDLGVDTGDPLQMLIAVRRLGAPTIENRYGVGDRPLADTELYQPDVPTDTFLDFVERTNQIRNSLSGHQTPGAEHLKLVVGSTDIHEYALFLLVEALKTLGVQAIIAGTSVDPDEFADLVLEAGADAVLVTTHNGMALTYAKALKLAFEQSGLDVPIAMGGTLNQDVEGEPAPVDVTDDLQKLGIRVCTDIADILNIVRAAT